MNVVVTPNGLGGVAIHLPVGKVAFQTITKDPQTGKETVERVERLVATGDILDRPNGPGVPTMRERPHVVLDGESLPDRYFRNAWEFHPEHGAVINLDGAREVQRAHWRKLRAPRLAALDAAYLRALEAADVETLAKIAAQKRALRDVTASPLPDDPDGIKAAVPAILTS